MSTCADGQEEEGVMSHTPPFPSVLGSVYVSRGHTGMVAFADHERENLNKHIQASINIYVFLFM